MFSPKTWVLGGGGTIYTSIYIYIYMLFYTNPPKGNSVALGRSAPGATQLRGSSERRTKRRGRKPEAKTSTTTKTTKLFKLETHWAQKVVRNNLGPPDLRGYSKGTNFFSGVYFSRGTQNPKKETVEGHQSLGDLETKISFAGFPICPF